MWIVVTLVLVLCAAVALAVWLLAPRGVGERTDVGVTHADADDFPDLGEPSARRPDGTPVPGSQEDRRRHGRP
jgi:hypothetical protein